MIEKLESRLTGKDITGVAHLVASRGPDRREFEGHLDKINEIVDLVNEQTEALTKMAEQLLNLVKELEQRDKAIMDLCTVVEKLAESKG